MAELTHPFLVQLSPFSTAILTCLSHPSRFMFNRWQQSHKTEEVSPFEVATEANLPNHVKTAKYIQKLPTFEFEWLSFDKFKSEIEFPAQRIITLIFSYKYISKLLAETGDTGKIYYHTQTLSSIVATLNFYILLSLHFVSVGLRP